MMWFSTSNKLLLKNACHTCMRYNKTSGAGARRDKPESATCQGWTSCTRIRHKTGATEERELCHPARELADGQRVSIRGSVANKPCTKSYLGSMGQEFHRLMLRKLHKRPASKFGCYHAHLRPKPHHTVTHTQAVIRADAHTHCEHGIDVPTDAHCACVPLHIPAKANVTTRKCHRHVPPPTRVVKLASTQQPWMQSQCRRAPSRRC